MKENGEGTAKNVFGDDLAPCNNDPVTGFLRDGFCHDVENDRGRHQICARMTEEFLEYSKSKGNDLMTPRPELEFPGLEPGDDWCVCVPRWLEALEDGVAPPVNLEATSRSVLDEIPIDVLRDHAIDAPED